MGSFSPGIGSPKYDILGPLPKNSESNPMSFQFLIEGRLTQILDCWICCLLGARSKVGILAVFWSFWGPEDYILFQENILPVFRSLSNPKSLALRALDFVHSSTPNH